MADWIPFLVLGTLLLLGLWLVSRKQVRDYKTYLDQHTAETAKQTETQRQLIDMQIAAIDRQTEALDRIAKALENRP